MTALRTLQRQFAAHLLTDDTTVAGAVCTTPGADAATRLGVYAHAYRQRLHEVLAEEFPGLQALAGEAAFAGWTARYARERPSRHPNIRWYGAAFADWLREAVPAQPAAAAMAELEWALSTAFDAPDLPALEAGRLAALPPQAWPALRLGLHPNLIVLPLAWNLDAIRRAADARITPPALAAETADLAIWRQQRRVRYRRLAVDEAAVLAGMRRGLPFGALCAALAEWHGMDAAAPRAAQVLRDWVEAGWIGGLDDGPIAV
ncbi:DNA-binding domain-containing protein [Dokdonella koreensis]|uniref:Putative DNA-binding domain-containing protein n=1 Tax=Dokdonella koreensis DS-123 TaxID=1300342 RepID=A0A167G8Z1_9GAMM|nr:putative DNA-binding domain-containing protein [Dokdonella koreensis]ANB16277.1 Hypothetical protein I596_238 [Dokdonella koreensis DS-123]